MAVVATGFFDGVHLGHQKVIETLVSLARERGEQSLILTFWPHPRMVLQNDARSLHLLTSLDEKRELLSEMGVDRVEVLPFSREFASIPAERYITEFVRDRFGAGAVVLGYDNRVGCDNLSPSQSAALLLRAGIEALVCPPVPFARTGENISSTLIRSTLSQGRVEDVAAMLGRPYSLSGAVVSGNRLGRTIGFPTANLKPREPLKALPGGGVYLTAVKVLGGEYFGMTNIGTRPTVSNGDVMSIETNIFGFDREIYGLDVELRFLRRIRDERRFGSLSELKDQLTSDKKACETYI